MTPTESSPGSFVVRVLGPDGQPAGAGVLVSERRIVTCAHVVNAALGRETGAQDRPAGGVTVTVDFPALALDQAASGPLAARVVAWVPPPRENAAGDDVAGLELTEPAPAGTAAAKLSVETPRVGRTLRAFGCPPGEPAGARAAVTVKDRPGNGRLVLEPQLDGGPRILPGFDGGPLVDAELGRVVGVVSEAPPAEAATRNGYAISTERLRLAWPEQLGTRRGRGRGAGDAQAELTILHLSDPQFGKNYIFGGNGLTPAGQAEDTLFSRLHHDLELLAGAAGRPVRPDLMVVTGDLAESGLASEFAQVTKFLGALAEAAEIPRKHVAIVPGNHDISRKACAAHFADAEADEEEPVPPYWPKWRHYAKAFADFYADAPGATFTPDEPWTLFEMPGLNVVVAGLNSTMAESHRDEDHYGWVGEHQLQWFASRLARYKERGWLRVAAVHHNAIGGAVLDEENLRDAADLDRVLGRAGLANLLLHGHTHDAQLHFLSPSGLAALSTGSAAVHADSRPAEVPNQYQLITIGRAGFTRHARCYALNHRRWIGDTRISASGSDWRDHRHYKPTDVDVAFPPPAAEPEAQSAQSLARDAPGRPGRQAAGTRAPGPRAPGRHVSQSAAGDRDVYMAGGNIYLGAGVASPIVMAAGGAGVNFDQFGLRENLFLVRVAQATQVRFPGARVDACPGEDCDYLRVSRSPDGGDRVDLWPVGVIDGPVDGAGLAAFGRVHAQFAAADPQVRSELVHTGSPAPASLVALARKQGIRLRTFVEYQGLLDLTPLAQAQHQRLTNDRIYPAGLYVEQRFRIAEGASARFSEVRTGLIAQAVQWLDSDDARLVVVLGDFGRGKTSFLRQLTRVLPEELPSVLPILVELRTLEKAPTLDELLAQHLVRNGVEDISPAKLRYMIRSGRLALLFDGFDELELRVGYDNAADYLQTLLDSVTGQAKVILTSRTQHFRDTAQVWTALGAKVEARAASRVIVLEDFSNEQVLQFLTNFYGGDAARALARFELIRDIENLLALAHNPRMLAFVAALETGRLQAVRERHGELTPAALYQEIIDYWLTFEERKHQHRWGPSPDGDTATDGKGATGKGTSAGEASRHRSGLAPLTKKERLTACTALAQSLWASASPTISREELTAEVARALTNLAELGYTQDQATHAIASGSLLVRTEEGSFTFIHQSIMEWLVANAAARRPAGQIFAGRRISRLMTGFYADLAGPQEASIRAFRALRDVHGTQIAKQNALDIALYVRRSGDRAVAEGTGPRVAERLYLSGVDLRGLDLTDFDLSGTGLHGATFRGMRLAGTDLSRVDLRDADLTGVRLTGGSLREAKLSGSRWDRAAILGTAGVGNLTRAPELRSAAIAGRDLAELMIRPPFSPSGVAYSPDGTLLAVASENVTEIIDVATRQVLRMLRGHTNTVTAVAFAPHGDLIGTTSRDGTARVWDAGTGALRHTLEGHASWARDVAFSADGTLIATASDDGTARIWNPATGEHLMTLDGLVGEVRAVRFSPDGAFLATADGDRTARIWDLSTGEYAVLTGHASRVYGMAFSPRGGVLATAAGDRTVRIWDTITGTTITTLAEHDDRVHAVAFSPDGTLLASASADKTVRIWDALTGEHRATFTGHDDAVRAVAFAPDGTLLVTVSSDRTARVWDVIAGEDRGTLTGHTDWGRAVAFAPGGALIAAASDEGTARVWSAVTGALSATLTGHGSRVYGVAFSPDGTLVATASHDGTVRTWDPVTGRHQVTFTGHAGPVTSVAFAPDGAAVVTASWDATVRVWDTATGAHRGTLEGHASRVNAVAFAPDGTLVATASDDATACTWDVRTGALRTRFAGHRRPVNSVCFSRDGTTLATASQDGTIRLRDTRTGAVRAARGDHAEQVMEVAFSPDGTLIASASADGTACVWDVATMTLRATFTGHSDWVRAVTFSPDGRYCATASDDATIQVWDAATADRLATLVALPDGGYATLLPDGRYKLSGDPGDRLWWAIKLCRFAPGELDPYVPGIRRIPDDEPILPPRQ